MNWRRWLRFGRVERREHLTLITTPAGVYAVEDGIPHLAYVHEEFVSGPMSDDVRWVDPEEIPYLIAKGTGGELWSQDRPGTTVDHEPPSLYDWERHGL